MHWRCFPVCVCKKQSCVYAVNTRSKYKEFWQKMDIYLADHMGVYRCEVWEKQITMIEDGKSYKLGNVMVRTCNAAQFISLGKSCVVEEIEDIDDVADDVDPEGGTGRAKVIKGDIVGITGNIKVAAVAMESLLKQTEQLEFAASVTLK